MQLLLAGFVIAVSLQTAQPAPNGRVSGIVVDENGSAPVAGARVSIAPADRPPTEEQAPWPEAITGPGGRFAFAAIPPGRYAIAAHKEGFALPMDDSMFPIVEVAADAEIADVVITMRRGGVITGVVLDPTGRPLAGASAMALLKRLETNSRSTAAPSGRESLADRTAVLMPLGFGETNERGEFRIDGLPSGDYLVAASASDAGGSSPVTGTTYFPSTGDQSAAEPVRVQAGSTRANIDVRLALTGVFQVSGVVVDESGTPIPNAFVVLLPDLRDDASFAALMTETHRSVQADANGAFLIAGVPSGAYVLDTGMGGIDGVSRSILIDDHGNPRADPRPVNSPLAPGATAVAVKDADVTDIILVVKK